MRLTVFEGHGTVRANGVAVDVSARPGRRRQSRRRPASATSRRRRPTFDQWALERDDALPQARAAQFVSTYMTGYEELDAYGDWVVGRRAYGIVWYPARRSGGLGAVPPRPVALDAAVGLDLGRLTRRGAMRHSTTAAGSMVGGRWCWVPGGYVRQSGVGARAGGLRRQRRQRLGGRRRAGGRLVSARAVAPLRAALSAQPALRHDHQPDDHQPAAPGRARIRCTRVRAPPWCRGRGSASRSIDVALPVPPKPAGTEADRAAAAERRAGTALVDAGGSADTTVDRGAPKSRRVVAPAQPAHRCRPAANGLAADARDAADGRRTGARARRDAATAVARQRAAPLRQPPGLKQGPAGAFRRRPPRRRRSRRARHPARTCRVDQIPPGQPQPINPAEPAALPARCAADHQAADGTGRASGAVGACADPCAACPSGPGAPAPAAAAPAPLPHPAAQPHGQPTPSQKEQVLRNIPEQERGRPVESEGPRRPKEK